jgi:hypothetical protein
MKKAKKEASPRAIAGTPSDPTLPKTPVTLDGKTYNLCFDLGALAEAEISINAELIKRAAPMRVNLLLAMPVQDLANVRVMFAAAVRTFHPELSFDAAIQMLRMDNIFSVAVAVREAWIGSTPEANPADPPLPGK